MLSGWGTWARAGGKWASQAVGFRSISKFPRMPINAAVLHNARVLRAGPRTAAGGSNDNNPIGPAVCHVIKICSLRSAVVGRACLLKAWRRSCCRAGCHVGPRCARPRCAPAWSRQLRDAAGQSCASALCGRRRRASGSQLLAATRRPHRVLERAARLAPARGAGWLKRLTGTHNWRACLSGGAAGLQVAVKAQGDAVKGLKARLAPKARTDPRIGG
jgi:hypothetical protein